MRRRAGGAAAGRETAEAVRKLCFRYRPHQRAGEDSRLIPLCPQGKSSGIAARAEMTDVLPGV